MIQGINKHQLLKIQEPLQKFINWGAEAVECPENWCRINCTLRRRVIIFFIKILERGRSIWSLFCTVSRKSKRRTESQLVKTSSRISQLHHYSRWVFGFSVKFQNKISEHGVENKIIKAQTFWLQKSRIKTMFIICNEKQCVTHRESVPEGKTKNSEFYTRVPETLPKWIMKARPQFKEKGSWLLCMTGFMLIPPRDRSTSWHIAARWLSAHCHSQRTVTANIFCSLKWILPPKEQEFRMSWTRRMQLQIQIQLL